MRIHAVAMMVAAALAGTFGAREGWSASPPESKVATDIRNWDVSRLYRSTWSADEMIGTEVRTERGQKIGEVKDIIFKGGTITDVVVEVGGFFEMGDQHIGVPWKDIEIGTAMQWVQVPLREVESGTYSLYGAVRHGEDVDPARRAWRANELIGDYASLNDVRPFGVVADLLFSDQGEVKAVVVDRASGGWGRGDWYAFPFVGYRVDESTFHLPYGAEKVAAMQPFSYARLVEHSRYASQLRREPATGLPPPAAGGASPARTESR